MTRTFKKRLLALVLTLALCTALMLPGFAAEASTEDTRSANNCAHNAIWVPGEWAGDYYYINHHSYAEHGVGKKYPMYCALCDGVAAYRYDPEDHMESHQVPCGKCGFAG